MTWPSVAAFDVYSKEMQLLVGLLAHTLYASNIDCIPMYSRKAFDDGEFDRLEIDRFFPV